MSIDYNLYDYSGKLIRCKKIDKLATGGKREIPNHLESIKLEENLDVNHKNVLLLDDVTTTGKSLLACYIILKGRGAKNIFPVALTRTVKKDFV